MRDWRHAPKRPINSLRDWRTQSFYAAKGKGIIVRASVSKAGCLLRAYWKVSGSHVDSTFIPRYFFEAFDLYNIFEFGDAMLRKPDPRGSSGAPCAGFDDESFQQSYPVLFSYMCDLCYEDGTARKTATLTLFADEGTLKGSLNDRDNERSLFLTARSLMELLDSLETALCDAKTVWRAYKADYHPQKRGSRKNG